jgi:hypothetical protein
MFFTSTQKYQSSIPKEDVKNLLKGEHVKIHDLDFEVMEKGHSLSIIPHAEAINALKTLPITHVALHTVGNTTNVVVKSKMRKIDSGGPQLLMIFCAFMFLASIVLFYVGGERMITYALLAVASIIFITFMVRMQMGYFDYVRKIQAYVKSRIEMAAKA